MISASLLSTIDGLPNSPGVYLFKDEQGTIVYIGKAKSLRNRVRQYVQQYGSDMKADTILRASITLEYIITTNELEALLLEARLIKTHHPRYNVLLKEGQPFLYLLITSEKLPTIKLVRAKKQKGTYFGPFLEKGTARKVYDFLIKTFRLYRCGKRIDNGCLYYHMGICAGFCRGDVDMQEYLDRMELARAALQKGHTRFLADLDEQIAQSNKQQLFEQSRDLVRYRQAFERVFGVLDTQATSHQALFVRDVWIWLEQEAILMLFKEQEGVLKKRNVFYLVSSEAAEVMEYVKGYYRAVAPPATVLISGEFDDYESLGEFFAVWHKLDYAVQVLYPTQGHDKNVLGLAKLHAYNDIKKRTSLPQLMQTMFALSKPPHTIDCFDISHKQGHHMVGSCVRFKDGAPDKTMCRKFYIKTVEGIDDYAALREIVDRRYREGEDLPDLVLIDGGKGQLNAVADLVANMEFMSLAKREETIFTPRFPQGKKLDPHGFVGQTLIALRDYAHHFALSFHKQVERNQ